jgi:hypothetical protein
MPIFIWNSINILIIGKVPNKVILRETVMVPNRPVYLKTTLEAEAHLAG